MSTHSAGERTRTAQRTAQRPKTATGALQAEQTRLTRAIEKNRIATDVLVRTFDGANPEHRQRAQALDAEMLALYAARREVRLQLEAIQAEATRQQTAKAERAAAKAEAQQRAEARARELFFHADRRWNAFWTPLSGGGKVSMDTHAALRTPAVVALRRQVERAGQAFGASIKAAEEHPAESPERARAMPQVRRLRDRYTASIDRFFTTMRATANTMSDRYAELRRQRGQPASAEVQAARRRLSSRAIGFEITPLADGFFHLAVQGQEVAAHLSAHDLVAIHQAYYPSSSRANKKSA